MKTAYNKTSSLRKLRVDRNLSIEQVADKLQVHKATLYRWESGQHRLHKRAIPVLAELYNIDILGLKVIAEETYRKAIISKIMIDLNK